MSIGSIKGFIAFALSQNDDRAIDNDSWNSCAVGDYAREVLGHEIPRPKFKLDGYSNTRKDPIVTMLFKAYGTKYQSEAKFYSSEWFDEPTLADDLCDGLFATYGELKLRFN